MGEQGRLFDTAPYEREQHPGDLHPDDWMQRPDVAFHGTAVDEAASPHLQPYTHYGTRAIATGFAKRASGSQGLELSLDPHDIDHYTGSPSADTPIPDTRVFHFPSNETLEVFPEPEDFHGGTVGLDPHARVYARRLMALSPQQFDDQTVNTGHALAIGRSGDRHLSQTVASSLPNPDEVDKLGAAVTVADELSQGRAVGYKNKTERPVGLYDIPQEKPVDRSAANSWLVPHPDTTTKSWEHDVLDSPNRNHAWKEFARQRLELGLETLAPIPVQRHPGGPVTHVERLALEHYDQ